ncbi:MAG TPA: hypothetical protein VJB16_04670, partial [archaeon]|nr:hypothetical protein [archaeon]
MGKSLLQQGEHKGAQAEFRAILQLDATHSEALRLMTRAQQQLEAAQAQAAQARGRLRNQAVDLALKLAREKAKEHAQQAANAKTQLARAREQQLKLFYHRGVGLYRQGHYQAAIDLFQQMVPLDPAHPLVQEARRLITRAETKQTELRARVAARASPGQGGALVSELEQQLTQKRIEIETVLKYAQMAMKERNYDMAIGLFQRVLAQDPRQREAQRLLEQAQLARLKDQEDQLKRQVHQDEQAMVNEVVKAQVLPEPLVQQVKLPQASPAAQGFSAKLSEPISLDFTDVALGDVVEFIADAANVSIIPSPQLDLNTRRVSLKVTQLPLELALKYLVKSQ